MQMQMNTMGQTMGLPPQQGGMHHQWGGAGGNYPPHGAAPGAYGGGPSAGNNNWSHTHTSYNNNWDGAEAAPPWDGAYKTPGYNGQTPRGSSTHDGGPGASSPPSVNDHAHRGASRPTDCGDWTLNNCCCSSRRRVQLCCSLVLRTTYIISSEI